MEASCSQTGVLLRGTCGHGMSQYIEATARCGQKGEKRRKEVWRCGNRSPAAKEGLYRGGVSKLQQG